MLSAVAETFENWKLRNSSDVNETYVYTTLPHFISKKWGCQWKVEEGTSKYLPKNAIKLRKFPHFCWQGEGGGQVQFL